MHRYIEMARAKWIIHSNMSFCSSSCRASVLYSVSSLITYFVNFFQQSKHCFPVSTFSDIQRIIKYINYLWRCLRWWNVSDQSNCWKVSKHIRNLKKESYCLSTENGCLAQRALAMLGNYKLGDDVLTYTWDVALVVENQEGSMWWSLLHFKTSIETFGVLMCSLQSTPCICTLDTSALLFRLVAGCCSFQLSVLFETLLRDLIFFCFQISSFFSGLCWRWYRGSWAFQRPYSFKWRWCFYSRLVVALEVWNHLCLHFVPKSCVTRWRFY